MIHHSAFVHSLACVDETVSIGRRSRVWQFASIIRGATLGEDCTVASGACLDGSHVGDRTKIGHNLAAGPGFRIGSDCFIGPNVTFCNDSWPRAHVEGWSADAFDGEKWAIIMRNGASIGAGSVILPGIVIGADAMVAAGAVVSRNVPDRCLFKRSGEIKPIARDGERLRFAQERAFSR